MSHQAEKRLLTARQTAAYLGVGLYTLKQMEYAGYLKPYCTLGGHRRYGREMLDGYLRRAGSSLTREMDRKARTLILVRPRKKGAYHEST